MIQLAMIYILENNTPVYLDIYYMTTIKECVNENMYDT